ncbi:hypothetical protein PCYB_062590 [Plasmodium cynomolgi strain B]|uniref:GYF domain-containing protein n=1 Tax=Plasmodium cynomolgi (strain B) TaxID=1120755 RepID=K6V8S6_PLACD|nr:hypothetical protein PCYB_062590 [Plasmodium cynomolgi strain B]GAB65527.1 hypothetical protein PCYB_062590 [Plasmodium cynomolgi strain B]
MLNEENVEVELVKLENEISKDKNETIYYEKDENENSYFNFAVNNFNYFECFYNEMYNCDFDEKEFKADHSFLNEEDHKGGSYNSLEIFESKDSSDEGTSKENGKARGVIRRGYVAMNTGEDDESADGTFDGESTKGLSSNRNGKNQPLKRERFTHSFNEDSSFEVNNVHAAILNAEEKTTNYSEDYFGFNIEPFNMQNELKEGYIDKHGNYVYNDPDGDDFEEAWLKSVDEEDPFTSFSSKKMKAKIHNETVSKFNKLQNQSLNNNCLSVNIYDALYSLSCLLIEKETPIKAMVRYKRDLKLCKNYLNECKLKLDKFSFVSAPRPGSESSKDPDVSKSCQGADADRSGAGEGKRDEDGGAVPRTSGKKNVLQVNLKRRGGGAMEKEAAEKEAAEKEAVEKEAVEKEAVEKEAVEKETLVNEAVDSEVIPNGDAPSEEGEKSEKSEQSEQSEKSEKGEANPHEEHPAEQEGQPRQEEPPAEEATEEGKAAEQEEEAAEEGKAAEQEEKAAEQEEEATEENDNPTEGEQPNELQRLEETYQKIALDYKTIERRFNNLIDLTQKLTNEYKNVYFLAKHECEALCKKLEESKEESVDIQWQLRWTSDTNNNVYGPYSYYDIYNLISVGIVSAENPIQLRRINKENKVLENIWQMYDAVNYLTFVSNESVKKKRKLSETNKVDVEEDGSDEGDNSVDDEYDIKKKKRKKKGLIQISKKKEASSTNEDDSDNEEDDYENYDY